PLKYGYLDNHQLTCLHHPQTAESDRIDACRRSKAARLRLVLRQGTCAFAVGIPEKQQAKQPPQSNRSQNMNNGKPDGHKTLYGRHKRTEDNTLEKPYQCFIAKDAEPLKFWG